MSALAADIEGLGGDELAARQLAAEVSIQEMGITFTVYSDGQNIDRAWPLDIIPRVIDASEWDVIETGLKQRLKARWWPSLTFGAAVFVMTLVPLANLLFIPGAVAGAVLMWQSHYRQLPAPRR